MGRWLVHFDYSISSGPFLRFPMSLEFLSEMFDHSVYETRGLRLKSCCGWVCDEMLFVCLSLLMGNDDLYTKDNCDLAVDKLTIRLSKMFFKYLNYSKCPF